MLTVRARPWPVAVVTITNVVTVTNEASKACFPHMALQGIVLNGAMSSAMINGRVLCIGEGFSNVVLVAVDAEHATVELEGQTKTLALPK
jgi:hypothetical protein